MARGAIRAWLVVLFVMVVAMIALGGATRLTGSGLSITEWKPVTGALPPSSAAAWDAEFAKYQQIPQFRIENPDMDVAGFKRIYWWEWSHRLLGRAVGLVWALGFLFFWATRRIPPGWTPRLLTLGVLGGLQGAVGWWMVASGLVEGMTSVASYRLAVHLGLAFAILGLIAWYVFQLARPSGQILRARRAGEPKLFSMTTGLMHLAFVQILLGAITAHYQVEGQEAYGYAIADALPNLRESEAAHVLTLSPPINLAPYWAGRHLGYTIAKYGMSLVTLGLAEEWRELGIAANSLWPRTAIATAIRLTNLRLRNSASARLKSLSGRVAAFISCPPCVPAASTSGAPVPAR